MSLYSFPSGSLRLSQAELEFNFLHSALSSRTGFDKTNACSRPVVRADFGSIFDALSRHVSLLVNSNRTGTEMFIRNHPLDRQGCSDKPVWEQGRKRMQKIKFFQEKIRGREDHPQYSPWDMWISL